MITLDELADAVTAARAALDPMLPDYEDHLDVLDALVATAGGVVDQGGLAPAPADCRWCGTPRHPEDLAGCPRCGNGWPIPGDDGLVAIPRCDGGQTP